METAGVISKDGLLTYDPLTGIVDSLPLPDQQIPLAGSLYIDNDQQLWTGIFGWFDKDFTWNAFHPEIDQYVVVDKTIALWRYFLPASLIFESSDGRLWFAIPSNSGSANLRSGMAWFDPITKEGCWFSSQGTRIVEDGDQSLWMTAGQSLYYLNLEPREWKPLLFRYQNVLIILLQLWFVSSINIQVIFPRLEPDCGNSLPGKLEQWCEKTYPTV